MLDAFRAKVPGTGYSGPRLSEYDEEKAREGRAHSLTLNLETLAALLDVELPEV